MNADVNAFDKLHMVRDSNSSQLGVFSPIWRKDDVSIENSGPFFVARPHSSIISFSKLPVKKLHRQAGRHAWFVNVLEEVNTATFETRLHQARAEPMAPIDLICLVADELSRRSDRLLERRRKQAAFRDHKRPWTCDLKMRWRRDKNDGFRELSRRARVARSLGALSVPGSPSCHA